MSGQDEDEPRSVRACHWCHMPYEPQTPHERFCTDHCRRLSRQASKRPGRWLREMGPSRDVSGRRTCVLCGAVLARWNEGYVCGPCWSGMTLDERGALEAKIGHESWRPPRRRRSGGPHGKEAK